MPCKCCHGREQNDATNNCTRFIPNQTETTREKKKQKQSITMALVTTQSSQQLINSSLPRIRARKKASNCIHRTYYILASPKIGKTLYAPALRDMPRHAENFANIFRVARFVSLLWTHLFQVCDYDRLHRAECKEASNLQKRIKINILIFISFLL